MTTKTRFPNQLSPSSVQSIDQVLISPDQITPEHYQDDTWQENTARNSPSGVADMDNLVYLYLSEMGQTPKLTAADEKVLGSQIEQGKHFLNLETELNES